jgi:hypothetical protein
MRVYISGPISKSRNDASSRFGFASFRVKERGNFPVNPMSILPYKLVQDTDIQRERGAWSYYMRESLKLLAECDSIYMLFGWQSSKGSSLELDVAKSLNFDIEYQSREEASEGESLDSGNYGQERIG